MLVVKTPQGHGAERDYILDVILGEFLGLSWRREVDNRQDVSIFLEEQTGEILLPDCLFAISNSSWLTPSSMPTRPLAKWDSRELGVTLNLVEAILPVIYGDNNPTVHVAPGYIRLPLDIFGSAFFLLTRYEEVVAVERDEYDRFPVWGSIFFQEGFLDRPLVDEYVEVLWAAMHHVWPGLQRKKNIGRIIVTCDVDTPYAVYTNSWRTTFRKVCADLMKRRSLSQAFYSLCNTRATGRGDYQFDPFDTFDWMMDMNERVGNRIVFYFLCKQSFSPFDAHYSLSERRIRQLMRRIYDRGHEIGLHGSFSSSQDKVQLAREMQVLRNAMNQERIRQEAIGCRQHYLRWNTPQTIPVLEHADIQYDSTLGFADRPGFRCGTSHEYPLFDFTSNRKSSLLERPLIVMESSVIDKAYMGMEHSECALSYMQNIKKICNQFNGSFVLLWHNSSLVDEKDKEFYLELIK